MKFVRCRFIDPVYSVMQDLYVPESGGNERRPSLRDAGTAFGMMNGKGSFLYRMGLMKRGIKPPSTMKMEKAASMTPEMTGTCTGSASSAGLSQYMERMTLK